MAERECTFELLCRGEVVESFTGPRGEAKARAEARLRDCKLSDFAFVREAGAPGGARVGRGGWAAAKSLLTTIFYVLLAIFLIWIELF